MTFKTGIKPCSLEGVQSTNVGTVTHNQNRMVTLHDIELADFGKYLLIVSLVAATCLLKVRTKGNKSV